MGPPQDVERKVIEQVQLTLGSVTAIIRNITATDVVAPKLPILDWVEL
jgi:hypothetical protein